MLKLPSQGTDTASSGDKFSVKKQNPDNGKLTFFLIEGDYAAFMPSESAGSKLRKTSEKIAFFVQTGMNGGKDASTIGRVYWRDLKEMDGGYAASARTRNPP